MNEKTNAPYKTTQPDGMISKFKNITPEGFDFFTMSVWAKSPNEKEFYIETTTSAPGSTETTSNWYGPFEGDLKALMEEAQGE